MKQKNNWLWVSEVVAALYVLLFVYTGVDKLRNWETFQVSLGKSPITRDYMELIGITIPTLELIVAGLLIVPVTRRIGLALGTGLMSIFTVYVAYMISFMPDLPCTCGGVVQAMSWNQHLFFNAAFVLAGILSLLIIIRNQLFIAINRRNAEHL